MRKTPLAIVTTYVIVAAYGLTVTIHNYIPDPRVEHWFLMKRWTPILLIICSYFGIVLVGPKLMQNRKPYKLSTVLKIYNLFQVLLSGYMFKEFLISAWQSSYSLRCQPVDYSNSPMALRMAAACWWFFFSKIIDTFDTVFFILRKKNSQVTFLHVYHHGSMIFNWWLGAKYTPGGQVFLQCILNSFVHVIMYTYYFLSAFGPHVQKYLWWKRYLTQLQLIQFCAIIIHLIVGMSTTCDFPAVLQSFVVVYCITLIALFSNFYIETYRHKSRERQAEKSAQEALLASKQNGSDPVLQVMATDDSVHTGVKLNQRKKADAPSLKQGQLDNDNEDRVTTYLSSRPRR